MDDVNDPSRYPHGQQIHQAQNLDLSLNTNERASFPTREDNGVPFSPSNKAPCPVPSNEAPYPVPSSEPLYSLPSSSPTTYSAPEVVYPNSLTGKDLATATAPQFSPEKEVKSIPQVASVSLGEDAKARRCGLQRRWFNIILILAGVLLITISIALGVGLGLGLNNKDSNRNSVQPFCRDHPYLCIGGASNPQYYSKKGVFNGTGIALSGEDSAGNLLALYFQHWTGDIRFMHYNANKEWVGGTRAQTIAIDARNATQISTVAYIMNGTTTLHLFYVNKNNIITQLVKTNASDMWEIGPLSNLNLRIYENSTTGLGACWKGVGRGDWDYPISDASSDEALPGIDLWYATDESTFQQYIWYEGWDDWKVPKGGGKFQGKNVHAGIGCYSWGEGTTSYTMMVNQQDEVEILWRDIGGSTSAKNKPAPAPATSHPLNAWINATQSGIGDVYPTASLGYTTFFYAQMVDRTIKGFNISYEAENSTIAPEDTFLITNSEGPVKGVGGTRLGVTAHAEAGEVVFWVFCQTDVEDITSFSRQTPDWTSEKPSIPVE